MPSFCGTLLVNGCQLTVNRLTKNQQPKNQEIERHEKHISIGRMCVDDGFCYQHQRHSTGRRSLGNRNGGTAWRVTSPTLKTMVNLKQIRGTMPNSRQTMNPDSRVGEFAFNVFDNRLGPSNDKWCCGKGGGIPDEGLWVMAEFEEQYALTHFTVSSANDVPARDPTVWEVQGSNDGKKFDTIYEHDGKSFWDQRLQVVLFEAGEDYDRQKTGYRFFSACYV